MYPRVRIGPFVDPQLVCTTPRWRIEPFAASIALALSRDAQVTGSDEPSASAQLELEDGIRTRDPRLGKVFEFIHRVLASPLKCALVHGTSTESTQIRPCCRAVYYQYGLFERSVRGSITNLALRSRGRQASR